MLSHIPRIIIAALKGGSGKTILSLGIAASWRNKGYRVRGFKKGPDFIDAGWLAFATDRSCHNLDPFMMKDLQILQSFFSNSTDIDISLIEGNRGLFDGLDVDGSCSTAELGKLLKTPVIIIADVTMTTRTIAALILGCQRFDPDLKIAAVILNRVAGSRQEAIIKNAIKRYCGIPVLGAVPKLKGSPFSERHMGLIPQQEKNHAEKAIEWARRVAEENLDLAAIWRLAHDVEPMERGAEYQNKKPAENRDFGPPRIGIIKDRSFWFYYPENLAQLRKLGASLVAVNSIRDKRLPHLDALYIGGGFPETQAEALANNREFRDSIKKEIEAGLPVYAECGGMMYMGENLIMNENTYPMVGVIPLNFLMEKSPQGHGYTLLEVTRQNPYHPVGGELRGHEFHYSRPVINRLEDFATVFKVHRGRGIDGKRDGLCKKNLLATYTHLHSGGNPAWGETFFRVALSHKHFQDKGFL